MDKYDILWLLLAIGQLMIGITASSSGGTHSIKEFIQPPTDKRYELYDFIATRIDDWSTKQLLIEGSTYSSMLVAYKDFMHTHKGDKTYADPSFGKLQQQMERFIGATEKLRQDPQNCALQNRASQELEEISKCMEFLSNSNNHDTALLNIIRTRYNEANSRISQDFVPALNAFFERLPTVIYNFKQNLNNAQKEEYKELLQCCNEFVPSASLQKKYQVFDRLTKLIIRGRQPRDPATNANCKWETSKFVEFPQKINSWSIGRVK
uniref:Uncharacterized protein n=1 Tax=Stomoxys calcitrans TaxID=35570 RepID=A0A1I8NT15_STOCA